MTKDETIALIESYIAWYETKVDVYAGRDSTFHATSLGGLLALRDLRDAVRAGLRRHPGDGTKESQLGPQGELF